MTTEPTPTVVTQMTPYDLTGIRDGGMRALVLLASSLGWNVLQRSGNPIVITARDGTQKRLPTNTSIRMSVYQTALSTIITHSQDVVPTVELIDKIVETVKLDRDHERRMRLAIGESAEEHKRRLATVPAAERKREPEEHLTQHIEIPQEDLAAINHDFEFVEELPPRKRGADEVAEDVGTPDVEYGDYGPADHQDHGKLIATRPFMAHRAGRSAGASLYQSDTCRERMWEDDFIDYTCVVCGQANTSSRGVGAHFQVHYKNGEVERPELAAWQRADVWGFDPKWKSIPRPKPEPEAEPVAEFIGRLVRERAAPFEGTDAESILEQIIELVAPNMRQQRDDALAQLAELQVKFDKLDADWKALRDLIGR